MSARTYLQTDFGWDDEEMVKVFCTRTSLPVIHISKFIPVDKAAELANLTLAHVLAYLDVLVPPVGIALVHPRSIMNYVKKTNQRKLRAVRKELYALINSL